MLLTRTTLTNWEHVVSLKKTKKAMSFIARFVILPYVCLASAASQAATIGELFVISEDPLFAEIPVCNPGPDGAGFSVSVVTDEALDSEGNQPFAQKIQASFDSYDKIEGLISISAEERAPDNVSLIVTLLDQRGRSLDSALFRELDIVRKVPESFGCVALVEEAEEVETTVTDSAGDFIIDIVSGDTWRNIADLVNISWYDRSYSVEQVMLALYKYNNQESLDLRPGRIYSLPDRLLVPKNTYPATIDSYQLPKASYLDEIGKLKVVKKKTKRSSELKKLRAELTLLKEQVDLLKEQITYSNELINLKNSEVDELRKNLVDTRRRISVLESENKELNERGIVSFIGKSFSENTIAWLAILLLLIIMIVWFSVRTHDARQRQRRNSVLINQHREKKK